MRGRLRAILTEDNALVRATVAELLEDMGFEVVATESGAQALKALAVPADLLIVDVRLPDISGLDVADTAREMQPDIRIIVASGEQAPEGLTHRWLPKPFNAARLRAALNDAIGDRWPPAAA